MGKIQINDEFLYQCMPELEEKLLNVLPEEDEIDYQFSERFQKKMRVLLKRAAQKEKYGIPVSTVRRIAAAILIALTATLTVSMSVEAVREKVLEFIRTVYETYTATVYYYEEEVVGVFQPFYPEYLPDGYELTTEEKGENYLILEYKSETIENGSLLIWMEQIQDAMEVSEDNEYDKIENCTIQGNKAMICYKETDKIRIVWEDDGCRYLVSGVQLTKEELIKISESLK